MGANECKTKGTGEGREGKGGGGGGLVESECLTVMLFI